MYIEQSSTGDALTGNETESLLAEAENAPLKFLKLGAVYIQYRCYVSKITAPADGSSIETLDWMSTG